MFPPCSDAPLGVQWAGEGRPLVCLHGFGGQGRDFAIVADQEARTRPLVALDLPGHGLNGHRTQGLADFEGLMTDLAETLAEPFDLLGYSMGGRLALWAALRLSLPIERLFLVGTTAGAQNEQERAERLAFDDSLIDRLEGQPMETFMAWWRTLPIIQSQARLPGVYLERLLNGRREQGAGGLVSSIQAFGTGRFPSLWDELAGLSLPTTLIVGEEDTKYRALATELTACIPESHIEVIPEAGHAAHLENTSAALSVLF